MAELVSKGRMGKDKGRELRLNGWGLTGARACGRKEPLPRGVNDRREQAFRKKG